MPNSNNTEENPRHIAIIMDGNGRWAKERNLKRVQGHKKGADALSNVIEAAQELNIKYLTFYAFSSENWSRPKLEIKALMALLLYSLKKYKKTFIKNKIRFKTIGDITKLPNNCQKAIADLVECTKDFDKITVVIALNYGSRLELEYAVKEIAKDVQNGSLSIDDIDYTKISSYLYTKDIPDPDLIIRTSGEHRLSNYLMLQAAYAEFYFTQTYWPDFNSEDFNNAIEAYKSRNRRFGKTQEQIQ